MAETKTPKNAQTRGGGGGYILPPHRTPEDRGYPQKNAHKTVVRGRHHATPCFVRQPQQGIDATGTYLRVSAGTETKCGRGTPARLWPRPPTKASQSGVKRITWESPLQFYRMYSYSTERPIRTTRGENNQQTSKQKCSGQVTPVYGSIPAAGACFRPWPTRIEAP